MAKCPRCGQERPDPDPMMDPIDTEENDYCIVCGKPK